MTASTPLLDKLLADDFGMLSTDTTPEKQLWHAVILRAIEDATIKHTTSKRAQKLKSSAQDWFYRGDHDFKRVCELAGLDADEVQFAALEYITRPDTGRSDRQSLRMAA